MRRSGKTTRAVDNAIQVLFKYGAIYIPTKTQIKNNDFDGIPYSQIVKDEDWYEGKAQDEFARRIYNRLQIEHRHLEIKFSRSGWLKIRSI